MTSFYSLSNHVGSLPAQTVQTGAHIFRSRISRVRKWHITSVPSKGVISDPLAFSTRGGNPNSGFTSVMDNRKSPLRIKLHNFTVRDNFRSQWINNFYKFGSQDELGSNPKQISKSSENNKTHNLEKSLTSACIDHHAVGRKEREQGKRNTRPNIITAGPKDFIHKPSMAGVSQ